MKENIYNHQRKISIISRTKILIRISFGERFFRNQFEFGTYFCTFLGVDWYRASMVVFTDVDVVESDVCCDQKNPQGITFCISSTSDFHREFRLAKRIFLYRVRFYCIRHLAVIIVVTLIKLKLLVFYQVDVVVVVICL